MGCASSTDSHSNSICPIINFHENIPEISEHDLKSCDERLSLITKACQNNNDNILNYYRKLCI